MLMNFDFFNRPEKLEIILCTPSKVEISSLSNTFNVQLNLKFNDISELFFCVPSVANGIKTPYYDEIKGKKIIFLKDIGYFKISNPKIITDGIKEIKECKAYSLEIELAQRTITQFEGTYKFYDPIKPKETLLGIIVDMFPSWSLGEIDSSLWGKYRTFKVSDQQVYNFLMTDVEEAYECLFTFDTFNKRINAKDVNNFKYNTGIYLSFDNLLKQVELEEISNEVITAMRVYGGNELDIRLINPNGTDMIYNFDYFKTTEWMSQSLINAINSYKTKFNNLQPTYSNYLTQLRNKNAQLLILKGSLIDLKNELTALEGVQKARIQAGQNYDDIYPQITTKRNQISSKENEIKNMENEIKSLINNLVDINNQLSFSNHFTSVQLKELDSFIIQETYQNDAFLITDKMTETEQQDVAQELYNQAVNIFNKVSQPKFKFNVSSANFIFLKQFEEFTKQVVLGSSISVEIKEGLIATPILLQISINYEKEDDFSLTFGNRYRLDDSAFIFSDLFEQAIKGGTNNSFNKYIYSDYRDSGDKVALNEFVNSALNAATNNVVSNNNQEIKIDPNGLRARQLDINTGQYNPKQLWMVNNMIAFSTDGFKTSKMALGEIRDDKWGSVYGLIGDVIVGRILAGNNLRIENSANQFTLDETGAKLTNASFTLTTSNNKGKIILNPTQGIKVQGNTGGTFVDKFYVDLNGNVVFSGNLLGASGTFSGTVSAGMIQGSTITGGTLAIGSNDKIIKLTGKGIQAGNANFDYAPFSVDMDGNLYAENVDISGNINGSTFTGGTIQTSSSGRRIVISNNRLNCLNGNIKQGFSIEQMTSGNYTAYFGLMYRNGSLIGGIADFSDNALTIYSNANLGNLGQDLILSGGNSLVLKSHNGIVCIDYPHYNNRVITASELENELSGFVTINTKSLNYYYTAEYVDNNFSYAGHTHDSRYIRPWNASKRCHIDLSDDGFLVIRDLSGNSVGHVEIMPA